MSRITESDWRPCVMFILEPNSNVKTIDVEAIQLEQNVLVRFRYRDRDQEFMIHGGFIETSTGDREGKPVVRTHR